MDATPERASDSVAGWLDDLRGGDPEAARRLWLRYFARMTEYSRQRMWASERLAADEEDVALSAFKSFCRAAGTGRLPDLDRDGLWPLLACIIGRKAAEQIAHERRLKRGGAAARCEPGVLDGVASADPGPDVALQMAEEFQNLLAALPDESLRAVALMKFEGHSANEIALRLGCALRSVERKLLVIRKLWSGGTG